MIATRRREGAMTQVMETSSTWFDHYHYHYPQSIWTWKGRLELCIVCNTFWSIHRFWFLLHIRKTQVEVPTSFGHPPQISSSTNIRKIQVEVPAALEAGEYVLSFRWDCKCTPQVTSMVVDFMVLLMMLFMVHVHISCQLDPLHGVLHVAAYYCGDALLMLILMLLVLLCWWTVTLSFTSQVWTVCSNILVL